MTAEYPAWDEIHAECPSCGEKINALTDLTTVDTVEPAIRTRGGLAPPVHTYRESGLAPAPETTMGRPSFPIVEKKEYYRCPGCKLLIPRDRLEFNFPNPDPESKNMTRKPSW